MGPAPAAEARLKKSILTVAGTRPELVKLAPLVPLLDRHFRHTFVYTGQHYTPELSRVIRADLGLRAPNHSLRGAGKTFAETLALQAKGLSALFGRQRFDFVLVQGDTNSALAGALFGARTGARVVHVEAGCRSGNLAAPEEQNRLLIDAIASVLFAADKEALANLAHLRGRSIFLSGSTGLDAAAAAAKRAGTRGTQRLGLIHGSYALATLHREENTSSRAVLARRLALLGAAARHLPVLFPMHPRTRLALKKFRIALPPGVRALPPLGYLDFLSLLQHCRFVLSDSGGIQEEAALLNRPCVVLREETEWLRLVKAGKNFLVPAPGPRATRLLQRLATDEAFYRRVRGLRAPGIATGAAARIVSRLRRL